MAIEFPDKCQQCGYTTLYWFKRAENNDSIECRECGAVLFPHTIKENLMDFRPETKEVD